MRLLGKDSEVSKSEEFKVSTQSCLVRWQKGCITSVQHPHAPQLLQFKEVSREMLTATVHLFFFFPEIVFIINKGLKEKSL